MMHRMLTGGVLAGFFAGLLAAILHLWLIQPVLLTGEAYETGALEHFADAGSARQTQPAGTSGEAGAAPPQAHDHAGAAGGGIGRDLLTVLFTTLIYVSYGLFLTLAFQIAETMGRPVVRAQGVAWGLAGFAAFQMAPALGLPPELPGTIAAELGQRQLWWAGTVLATAAGIAVMAFGRSLLVGSAGAVLLVIPHLIGAPHPEQFWGLAPPELGAEFAARALGVGMVAWIALGWLAARVWTSSSPD